MGNLVKRLFRRVGRWLLEHHVLLVILLSLSHVGLSFIQVRDSGGADPGRLSSRSAPRQGLPPGEVVLLHDVEAMVALILYGPPEGPGRAEWRDEQRQAYLEGTPATDPLHYLRLAGLYIDQGLINHAVRDFHQRRSEQTS